MAQPVPRGSQSCLKQSCLHSSAPPGYRSSARVFAPAMASEFCGLMRKATNYSTQYLVLTAIGRYFILRHTVGTKAKTSPTLKRELGETPRLPRSGKQERTPSSCTGRVVTGKRRAVGRRELYAATPASPKTCHSSRLILARRFLNLRGERRGVIKNRQNHAFPSRPFLLSIVYLNIERKKRA